METLHLPLLNKREIARDTYSFVFPRPESFTYTAGQYISLSVDEPGIAAPGGTMRELSLVSAPYEDILEVALRYRESSAKQQYLLLEPGDHAYLQGPFGSFHLDEKVRTHCMLAGGIGIVPFLSLIKQSIRTESDNKFMLFCANRTEADIPYLPELEILLSQTNNLTLVNTLTLEHGTDWRGEKGYISPALIQQYIKPGNETAFYISGPMRFVGGMWDVLGELGIADQQIHGEEFTGY